MKSLFDLPENQKMIDRINRLTPQAEAQWGTMNVAQMLAHAGTPIMVALGDLKLKKGLAGIVFGRIVRRMIVNEKPFKRNSPTDKRFIIADERQFDTEKGRLIDLVQRFAHSGPNGLTKEPHPFFGKLSPTEWDLLMWKHLDHHLQQFGV